MAGPCGATRADFSKFLEFEVHVRYGFCRLSSCSRSLFIEKYILLHGHHYPTAELGRQDAIATFKADI
jgi:hypothetical protein